MRGREHFDVLLVFCRLGARRGNAHVTRPTQRHADGAASQVVDVARGREDAHVLAHLLHHGVGLLEVGRALGVLRNAEIVERSLHDVAARVEHGDAAGLDLVSVGRIKNQGPGIGRHGGVAQRLFHLVDVDAYRGVAPHPGNEVFVARINRSELLHQARIEVFVVGDLGFVERMQQAALDVDGRPVRRRHHDVIAGIARHHFGEQGFVGVEGVVAHLDAGVLLETRHRGRGDVVGPVVDIEHAGGLRRGGSAEG